MTTSETPPSYPMAEAVARAYLASQDDEKIEPLTQVDDEGNPVGRIRDGDYVIFYDIRGEREIELTEAFTASDFSHFPTLPDAKVHFATMIQYDPRLDVQVAFPPARTIEDTLSETISIAGKKQIKISESEKATHVTFFFNGKRKQPFPGIGLQFPLLTACLISAPRLPLVSRR